MKSAEKRLNHHPNEASKCHQLRMFDLDFHGHIHTYNILLSKIMRIRCGKACQACWKMLQLYAGYAGYAFNIIFLPILCERSVFYFYNFVVFL